MTTTATGITIERTLAAGIQRVYDAWTKPELMVRWYCPNPALDLTAEADLRVGGDWVVAMGPNVVRGSYTELDEPRLIAFTWKWDFDDGTPTHVRVELTEAGEGTRLVLRHTGFASAEDVANHAEGWEGCVERLPGLLASQSPA